MTKPLRARWLTFFMRASESRDRSPYIYAAIFVLVAWVSALFAIYKAYDSEVTHLKNAFIEQKNEDTRKKIGDIQNFFKSIYESIRTIAMLPSVRKIDRYGKSLDADAKETIQQIYNNAYLNAAISEFYILPKNFDPDRVDPRTGELERPVMTFDEFISGINKGNKTNQKDKILNTKTIGKEVLKEEEIYEYREMVKQLKELENIPKNASNIDRLNFPALVSDKVITCDNSQFSIADLQNKNDEPRKGYVYTVPKFDHSGTMNGAVSAVFLHSVISNALGESSMALVNREHDIFITHNPSPTLVLSAKMYFKKNQKSNPNLIHSSSTELKINDDYPWELWVASDNSEFLNSSDYVRLQYTYIIVAVLMCIFAMIGFAFIYISYTYTSNLSHMVEDRTHELRTTVHQLEESQAQLVHTSKMSSLGEMATGMAHEINNPLAIANAKISQVRRLVEAKSTDYDKMLELLNKAESTNDRIAKIIRGLRAFARNDENDEPISCSMNQIIEDTLELCQEKIKMQSIQMRIGTRVETTFEGHPAQISQVLMNLISNAIDALSEKTFAESERWIEISCSRTPTGIKVSVTDAGKGIPDEVVKRLMEPFFTTKEVGRGTGLGLSISRGIIESHHGKFYYDRNCPNTRFSFELPLTQVKSEAAS